MYAHTCIIPAYLNIYIYIYIYMFIIIHKCVPVYIMVFLALKPIQRPPNITNETLLLKRVLEQIIRG